MAIASGESSRACGIPAGTFGILAGRTFSSGLWDQFHFANIDGLPAVHHGAQRQGDLGALRQ